MDIVHRSVDALKANPRNARTHSKSQLEQIAQSIRAFGFNNPILVDSDLVILAGHGRVAAARLLGLESIPTVELAHLTDAEKRAYVIADNRLAELSGWDRETLAIELVELSGCDLDFEITDVGFSAGEIDLLLTPPSKEEEDDPADEPHPLAGPKVTRPGDLWFIGNHRLLCGDALQESPYEVLMSGDRAQMVFTDPPIICRSRGTCRVWAACSTVTLSWLQVRCRKLNSPAS